MEDKVNFLDEMENNLDLVAAEIAAMTTFHVAVTFKGIGTEDCPRREATITYANGHTKTGTGKTLWGAWINASSNGVEVID
jgi:hypothetical protein